jgi:hypothetical protein
MRTAVLAVSLSAGFPLVAYGQNGIEPAPAAPPETSSPSLLAPVPEPPAQQPTPPPPPVDHTSWGNEGDSSAGTAASARGPFSIFSSAEVGHLPSRADYRATWFPDEEVKGQGTNLGFLRQDLTFSCPIWQCSPDELSVSAHVRSELFHTGAVFPDTGQPFPEELWNIHVGTTYRHLFDNGWIAGGTVSVGSASDKPFNSINEMTAGVNGFLRLPQGEHNAWLFTLSYSSNSELPIPIPGVAFLWQPSDQFRMNIGLPFQIMYRPCDDLTLDFSYMLLTSVHARVTYRVSPNLRIYGGYDYNNESYLPADRLNENDRLFYYDQHLTAGMQFLVSRCATVDFSGGYTFDRFYFEGHSFSDRSHNRIDVGDGLFLSADFRVRW